MKRLSSFNPKPKATAGAARGRSIPLPAIASGFGLNDSCQDFGQCCVSECMHLQATEKGDHEITIPSTCDFLVRRSRRISSSHMRWADYNNRRRREEICLRRDRKRSIVHV
jgi:hypothetical protein